MVFLYLRKQDNGEESKIPPGATRDNEVVPGKRSFPTYVAPSHPCIPWPTMEVRLTLQELAEIGSHGFSRVSRRGHRGDQAGNGRKWWKMAENGGKWQKMVENGLPRLFGRKWIFAYFTPFPYYW